MAQKLPPANLHRALIDAKIAAGDAAVSAVDPELLRIKAALKNALENFFPGQIKDVGVARRRLTNVQMSGAGNHLNWWWRFGELSDQVLVGLSDGLILAACDMMIARRLLATDRDSPTVTDRALATGLAETIAAKTSHNAEEVKLAKPPPSAPLGAVLPRGAEMHWRYLALNAELSSGSGSLTAAVAKPAPEAVSVPPTREALLQRFGGLSVAAQCHAGQISMQWVRILKLRKGEVFPVAWNGKEAKLLIGGRTAATGEIGESAGQRAIRINRKVQLI